MNKLGVVAIAALILFGCEKKIDFELDESSEKLVVEATIENNEAPRVILTRSVGYFSELTPQVLTQNFVHQAEVYVSNGTFTHKLKEYQVPITPTISIYYYSIDSTDLSTAFVGELNTTYTLLVKSEGKEYTSLTTIPAITKEVDSLWWKPVPNGDTTKAIIMVRATDPPGYGDYVRYLTSQNGGPFFPPRNSVFDDYFIDGTTYEVSVEPGYDRSGGSIDDDDFFNRGDTITFKLSNIDKTTYDFWRTWEFAYESIGNPFSTPTKVIGNISNGALGYFAGYATQYHTIITQ